MKQLLTLTLLFTITNVCMSQTLNVSGRIISGKTSDLGEPISKLLVQSPKDNFDKIQFFEHRTEVLRLSPNGDIIEIKSPSIKFIKIDGKTYEIKRNTELKEVKPNWTTVLQEFAIKTDSSLAIRYDNKPTKQ